jgi:hypothetical protein
MPTAFRFPGGQPTPLLFIEPGKQQVQLPMQRFVRMVSRLEAIGTLTLVNGSAKHFRFPADKTLAADCTQESAK